MTALGIHRTARRHPGDRSILGAALAWLDEFAQENLGTPVLVQKALEGAPLGVALATRGEQICGVSVVTGSGKWFLESADPEAANALLRDEFEDRGRELKKLTASSRVGRFVQDSLRSAFRITREHDLYAMVCTQLTASPDTSTARWAEPRDVPRLREYEAAYDSERRTLIPANTDWSAEAAEGRIAVIIHDSVVVAVLRKGSETARFATVGGTFTFPEWRRRGFARALTCYVVSDLLRSKAGVQLIVDDDNAPAISLYEQIGFKTVGQCYMAYLER